MREIVLIDEGRARELEVTVGSGHMLLEVCSWCVYKRLENRKVLQVRIQKVGKV